MEGFAREPITTCEKGCNIKQKKKNVLNYRKKNTEKEVQERGGQKRRQEKGEFLSLDIVFDFFKTLVYLHF